MDKFISEGSSTTDVKTRRHSYPIIPDDEEEDINFLLN